MSVPALCKRLVAAALGAALTIGCGGSSQIARWASQETGCPSEEITISGLQRDGNESASYYATCDDGSLYECVSSGRYVEGVSTTCDILEGAEGDERRPTLPTQAEVEAQFAREMRLPPSREVAATDGRWVTAAPSVTAPALQDVANDVTQVQFGLSTEVQAECFFYPRELSAGAAVATLLAEFSKSATFVQVGAYRVAEAGGYPVAFIEGIYTFEKDGRTLAGSLKIGVSPRFNTPVVCVLDEPGYRKSFAEFMVQLLSGLKTVDQPPAFRLTEGWRYEMDGAPIGFSLSRFVKAADGTLADLHITATFLPVSPGELSTSDSTQLQISDAKGPLKGTYVLLENGRVHSQIELKRGGGRNYKATGTLQGKPFQATLFAEQKLASPAAAYAQMRKTAGRGGLEEWLQYMPDIDPETFLKVRYQLDPAGRTFDASIAELHFTGKRGRHGLPVSMQMPMGERKMDLVLMHRAGTL